jgi:hypothetical protein
VNELMQFIESHPAGIKSKNEEHTLNEIGLAGTVGSDNGSEIFMKRANFLGACIRFEIFQDHVINDKAGFALLDED